MHERYYGQRVKESEIKKDDVISIYNLLTIKTPTDDLSDNYGDFFIGYYSLYIQNNDISLHISDKDSTNVYTLTDSNLYYYLVDDSNIQKKIKSLVKNINKALKDVDETYFT